MSRGYHKIRSDALLKLIKLFFCAPTCLDGLSTESKWSCASVDMT
jgi:hypothetical protein